MLIRKANAGRDHAPLRGVEAMSGSIGWLERMVDRLPTNPVFEFLARRVLVPFWAWRTPVPRAEGGAGESAAPGDNIQRMMNLVMKLKDPSPIGRAKAAMAIAQNVDEIYAGLNNVGTVHFARFVLVGDHLCMFSVYDGDFSNYIRDFIATIGSVFDAVVALIEGGDAVIPAERNVEAFIDWVHARDLYQVPDFAADILRQPTAAAADETDIRCLPRQLILQLRANQNASLGSGYRAYPGFSAAQVRQKLEIGW